ncbi:MAG: FtsW/RodA/SpoVE family cell cycle protein [Anaerolineae bacterium]|nr:FtsW/RodA/SpoVE family cell cycle protein [Anaerolineae bacterium]
MRTDIWRHFDFWLLGTVALLVIIGVVMINSAIAGNITLIENQAVSRQIVFALAGIIGIIIVAMMDYHLWVAISRVLYFILVIFLGLTLFSGAGEEAFGAQRLLNIGFETIQPSEVAKIALIVLLANYFSRQQANVTTIMGIARSLVIPAGLVILILAQPDLSTSIVLIVIWFSLLFASGLRWKHLIGFAVAGIVLSMIAFPFLQPYQQQRVINFAFPDPEATFGAEYNVNQALISIGSGGFLGQGYGQSPQVQLRFLKVRHNDFIFSTIGAELGMVGSVIILLLLFFLIWRCIRAARLSRDTLGSLIAYGVATWIAFQTFVNVGMNLNLIPVTGLPLPFISHGGSSLLSLMLGIGLVESVVSQHATLEF